MENLDKDQKKALKEIPGDYAFAQAAAKVIFGTESPSEEAVFGFMERACGYDEDGREVVCNEMAEAVIHARGIFVTPTPTPRQVFYTFDVVYAEVEEGDDE